MQCIFAVLRSLCLVLDLVLLIVANLLAEVGSNETALCGLALGLLDDAHDRGRLGEEHLELFERTAHGLGVEEVNERHDAGGDDGVDDEVTVADGVDGDGGDLEIGVRVCSGCFEGVQF